MLAAQAIARPRRPRGGGDAVVAEPGGDSEDSRRSRWRLSRCGSRPRAGSSMSTACSMRLRRARARCSSTRRTTRPAGPSIATAQRAILEHCRRQRDLDRRRRCVRAALHYGGDRRTVAPSFLDIAERDERVISTNTFSKSWLMTGFRLGWIVAPQRADARSAEADRIQHFVRTAVRAARRDWSPSSTASRWSAERWRVFGRRATILVERARSHSRASKRRLPAGAMYAFFRVGRHARQPALCKQLVAQSGLGLAPGIAFGPEGEGFVRWCFAAAEERLADGIERLRRSLHEPQAAHR